MTIALNTVRSFDRLLKKPHARDEILLQKWCAPLQIIRSLGKKIGRSGERVSPQI